MAMIISNKKLMTHLDIAIRILAKHRILMANHIEHANFNV